MAAVLILCGKLKLCKLAVAIFELVDKRTYACTQISYLVLMLKQLSIQNYLLVDNLSVEFMEGMTTVTGESGAGKSILLDALDLLLGARAKRDEILHGDSKIELVAEFDIGRSPDAITILVQDEFTDFETPECIIRRVINPEGRSRAFINNIPVTQQFLRSIGDFLVDIQGQDDFRRITSRKVQLQILDEYTNSGPLRAKVAELYDDWQKTLKELEDAIALKANQIDRVELLGYQIQELLELSMADGELDSLEDERKILENSASISETLSILEVELNKIDIVRSKTKELKELPSVNKDLVSGRETLATALDLIDDAQNDLRSYAATVKEDPARLSEIETRLGKIFEMARKHRVQPEELSNKQKQIEKEIGEIDQNEDRLNILESEVDEREKQFQIAGKKLSQKRREAAPDFCSEVNSHFASLGLDRGAIEISFEDRESAEGLEQLELLARTVEKFDFAPLRKIASGGEMTRVNLAIQAVAAKNSHLPCLILDEADVGVGGTISDSIGRLLRNLSETTQVLCVTHAPQVAAIGQQHFKVVRENEKTNLLNLEGEDRVKELARMLAGSEVTPETTDFAKNLLAQAMD